jgi:bifunctional DNA-binding transcriptional regulator/antitoxin component of YhaV-PrlF toxin-antitoxin module
MSMAEVPNPGPEVVVGADGSLAVPTETLARFGIRPGAHLRLVPEPEARERKTSRGVLKGQIDAEAFAEALRESKEERIAAALREDEE